MKSHDGSTVDRTALLAALSEASVRAGEVIMRFYRTQLTVTRKSDSSPVTDADSAAEAIILEALAMIAPNVPVVAEEEVAAGRVPTTAGNFFLVDPLDGTKEFIEQRGDFTVNIALIENGAPSLGVVYAPVERRLFAGDVATGKAWSAMVAENGGIGPQSSIRIRLAPKDGITAVASRSHSSGPTHDYLTQYPVRECVSRGSSLKICMVAAGVADLYPRLTPTYEWDIAAGDAVLRAAGGTLRALDGKNMVYGKERFFNPGFVATGDVEMLPITPFMNACT